MTNTSLTEKIGKLLAQAEGAGTEAEAAAFMDRAQQLATTYSIDLAKARHATKVKERSAPTVRRITLGERGTRGLNTLVSLITNIGEAQGLRCTISHHSTYVNFYGFAEDIDITEALYASLSVQMVHACEEFKATGTWKNDKVWSDSKWAYVPVSWLTARLDFQQGFASRIGARLCEARRDAERQAREAEDAAKVRQAATVHLDENGELSLEFMVWFYDNNDNYDLTATDDYTRSLVQRLTFELDNDWTIAKVAGFSKSLVAGVPQSTGTELVLADKAREVNDFYTDQTRHIRGSYRGGRSGVVSAASSRAGRAAGDSARLSSSTSLPGARKALA